MESKIDIKHDKHVLSLLNTMFPTSWNQRGYTPWALVTVEDSEDSFDLQTNTKFESSDAAGLGVWSYFASGVWSDENS